MSSLNTVLLGLGSNKGERQLYLQQAIQQIHLLVGPVIRQADLYETAAWGKTDQNAFLNTCILVKTILPPKRVLQLIKQIETHLGRKEAEHWGPREIDIDILLYNTLVLDSEELAIPHKSMTERNFVLVPAAEIAATRIHPTSGLSIRQLLKQCPDTLAVHLWKP